MFLKSPFCSGQILLQQLKSPSLTVVSNACGSLWNLSARCPEDQRALWELGAVGMLKSLVNSKHKMISMGSSAALKNLLGARPAPGPAPGPAPAGVLSARKQRALEQQLDLRLAETCDNIEPPSPAPAPTTNATSPLHRQVLFSYSFFFNFSTTIEILQKQGAWPRILPFFCNFLIVKEN